MNQISIKGTNNARESAKELISAANTYSSCISTLMYTQQQIKDNWEGTSNDIKSINTEINNVISVYSEKIIPALQKLGNGITAFADAIDVISSKTVLSSAQLITLAEGVRSYSTTFDKRLFIGNENPIKNPWADSLNNLKNLLNPITNKPALEEINSSNSDNNNNTTTQPIKDIQITEQPAPNEVTNNNGTEHSTQSETINVDSNYNERYSSTAYSGGGFQVTTDNKKYNLSDEDFDLLCAIVSAESDKTPDDALAVVSTILNRCEDPAWIHSHGDNPISQATAPNQYVVYQHGHYKKFLGNAPEEVKIAVRDALNGVRNTNYLSFRSNSSVSHSNNMISATGNRYSNPAY